MDKPTKIKSLTKGYFQKSTFFLYPLLRIPKKILPVQTYVYSNLELERKTYLVLCRFNRFTDPKEKGYEKEYLSENPLFCNYFDLEDDTCLYIFEFTDERHKETWDLFTEGKYSEFPGQIKRELMAFFKKGTRTYDSIYSYLFPADYYNDYAELLNISVDILQETKELTDKPDEEKETMKTPIRKLDLSSIM